MAVTIFALTCPHCGGALEVTARADLFRCGYCRQLALVRWTDGDRAPDLGRLVERHAWKANLLRPGASINWQGGELVLAAGELAFVPHALNAGALERAVLPLGAIVDLRLDPGIVSDELTLTDDRGDRWGVRVFRGVAVRDAIEGARSGR